MGGSEPCICCLRHTVPQLCTEVSGSTLDEQGLAESEHSLPAEPSSTVAMTWLLCGHLVTKNGLEALRNPNKRPAKHQRPGLLINDYFTVTTPHICFK